MKAEMTQESYALVEKIAFNFAHNNTSTKYEEYVNAGLEGLVNAIKTYNKEKGTQFSTYASGCIANAMRTKHRNLEKWTLTHDDNVEMDSLTMLSEEPTDYEMWKDANRLILKVNNGNQRNAEIFMRNIGMNGEEPMDYKELSRIYNVSAERARQICVNTRREMQKHGQSLYGYVG